MSLPSAITYAAPVPPVADLPAARVDWQPDADRAVLLVHDMQRYFVRPFAPDAPALLGAVARIAELVDAARAVGVPVVWTAQPGDQDPADRGLMVDTWGTGITSAPDDTAILPEVAPRDGEVVLVKHRYSAFARSDLAGRMAAWGRDQLVITGIYAHIGVVATATDAYMRDIQPFLVADAVADFSAEDHAVALRQVARTCGQVLMAADVREAWASQEAAPAVLEDPAWVALAADLAELIGPGAAAEAISDPDADLFELGLDSLRAFELLDRVADRGVDVDFADFVTDATWRHLAEATRSLVQVT